MMSLQPVLIYALLIFSALTAAAEIGVQPVVPFQNHPAPGFTNPNRILIASNDLPKLVLRNAADAPPPPPGVYLTKPYTCLLMVPGPQHDDCCMNRWTAPVPAAPLPVLRPDLKTVPLGRSNE
jgi:hypothetical protein